HSHMPEHEAPANTEDVTSFDPIKGQDSETSTSFQGPNTNRVLVNENYRKLITVSRSSYSGIRTLDWVGISYLYADGSEAYIPLLQTSFPDSDPFTSMNMACRTIAEASSELLYCPTSALVITQTDASPTHPNLVINRQPSQPAVSP